MNNPDFTHALTMVASALITFIFAGQINNPFAKIIIETLINVINNYTEKQKRIMPYISYFDLQNMEKEELIDRVKLIQNQMKEVNLKKMIAVGLKEKSTKALLNFDKEISIIEQQNKGKK